MHIFIATLLASPYFKNVDYDPNIPLYFVFRLPFIVVPDNNLNKYKGHFTKVYSNKGGQPQNFSGILSAVYILYVVIKGTNKVFLQF